jgi:hypothetical protein
MAMGKRRRRAKQPSMWIATQDLPRSAAHPFSTRLNQILDKAGFDEYVEALCQRFYADEIGRPGLPAQLLRPSSVTESSSRFRRRHGTLPVQRGVSEHGATSLFVIIQSQASSR